MGALPRTDRIRHWECISSGVAIETDSVSSRSSSGVYSLNEHSPPPARIESFFAENLVYLKGQGPDQAVVKMKRDGTLIFAELDTKTGSGEGFIFKSHLFPYNNKEVLCSTFESSDYVGRHLVADTRRLYVSGETITASDHAYWRKPFYSQLVPGDTSHRGAFCLQYWGGGKFRLDHKKGLFLVVEGSGSSAKFTLRPLPDLIKNQNGIFSI